MADQEKPLPKPPKTPFGRKRAEEGAEGMRQPLMADEMAMAAAQGKLDEYMKEHLPDNEHARQLAMMMLSMSGMGGMMPPGGFPEPASGPADDQPKEAVQEQAGEAPQEAEVPEEVMKAVHAGDMESLMGLLRQEHEKRTGRTIPVPAAAPEPGFNTAPAGIEKEVLDQLLEIAAANNVTIDWLILRAMKSFIEEYRRTGKL